jgi:hypothetical protein
MILAAALLGGVASRAAAQQTPLASTERRGWFGISLSCSDCYTQVGPGRVAYTRYPAISSVESGSPAHQAGLRYGDTLLAIEGLPLTSAEGFERFAGARPGEPVRLTVRKGGEQREVVVVPTSGSTTVQDYYRERLRIAQRRGYEQLRNSFRTPLGWLGMGLECEQCSVTTLGRRAQNWTFRAPPAVLTVDVDGPAHRAGLRRGDTVTAIDGVDLTTTEGGRAFAEVEPGQRVTLTVRRDGRERRVSLAAVVRPDASRQELAAFEEYRRIRDSVEAIYREMASASMARAQAEIREMERLMRELERNRHAIDSTRRRVATIDSVLRALRSAERELTGETGLGLATPRPARAPVAVAAPPAPVAPIAPVAPAPPVPAAAPPPPSAAPLRYSGRLGNLVNVEARAPGGVNVQEVADTMIVVTASGVEVRVIRRGEAVPPRR